MGGFDQPLGQFSVQSRQADLQRDFQAETTRNLADPDVGGDGRFCRKRLLLLASDEFQGTDEAGRVACRKELLRVGRVTALTAKLPWCGQPDVKVSVRRYGATVASAGGGIQGLDGLHGALLVVRKIIAR